MISYKIPDNMLPDHIKIDALSEMDPFDEPEGVDDEDENEFGMISGRA